MASRGPKWHGQYRTADRRLYVHEAGTRAAVTGEDAVVGANSGGVLVLVEDAAENVAARDLVVDHRSD